MTNQRGHTARALAVALLVSVLGAVAAGCDPRGGSSTQLDGLGSSLAEIQRRARGEGSVELVAWPGYADASWVGPFERQTNCRVEVQEVATTEAMWSALDRADWDAVSASGADAGRLVQEGRVVPVDTALVPNYEQLVPGVRTWLSSAEGDPYGMPFGRTPNLLLFRTDVFPGDTDSWSALWDEGPRLGRRVSIPDDPFVIADAAVYLKATRPDLAIDDPYELDQPQLQAAVHLLRRLDPTFVSPALQPVARVEQLVAGETVVAMASPADAELLEGAPVRAEKPIEGTTGRFDAWMVSRGTAHPNCTYLWLDYVGSPSVQAAAADLLDQAPVNPAACALMRDRDQCTELHATDDAWWEDVSFRATPVADCGDDREETCTDEDDWAAAWASLRRLG